MTALKHLLDKMSLETKSLGGSVSQSVCATFCNPVISDLVYTLNTYSVVLKVFPMMCLD